MSRLRIVCGILSLCLSCAFFWSPYEPARAADLSGATLVEKGALTYGVAATFAPFEFQKEGTLTGFDIDMIGLLAKKLGAEPKPMNMEFKGLIVALQGGRLDLINSAMYINEQRSA
jgi:polar amino acid transport system substrate-binding protein